MGRPDISIEQFTLTEFIFFFCDRDICVICMQMYD